jgi:DNA (cytosine-5)-methyltransferase 1
MKGFTSAYKRMRGDLPAAALTRNLSYVSSDQKVHPSQHRVLSLLEAMRLHTLTDFQWTWKLANGKPVSDKLIRETIGESIPPRGLKVILDFALTNTLR